MKPKRSIVMAASLAASWEVGAGRVGTVRASHQGVLTWAPANVSFVSNDYNSGVFSQLQSLNYSIVEPHAHTAGFSLPVSQLGRSHCPSLWAPQDPSLPLWRTCTAVNSLHALCSCQRDIGAVRLSKQWMPKNWNFSRNPVLGERKGWTWCQVEGELIAQEDG